MFGKKKRDAARLDAAKTRIVTEAVAIVVANPPGTFPALQHAITRAVQLDVVVNGPLPGQPTPPPAPAKRAEREAVLPDGTPAPPEPIDIEAEVAAFRAELDSYPSAEEPKR